MISWDIAVTNVLDVVFISSKNWVNPTIRLSVNTTNTITTYVGRETTMIYDFLSGIYGMKSFADLVGFSTSLCGFSKIQENETNRALFTSPLDHQCGIICIVFYLIHSNAGDF